MPFERPVTVNEPSDKFPAQSFAVRDGSKTLDFDLSALAINGSWTFPAPAAGDAAKVLFGDGSWQSIPGGGDMLGANNLSDVASVSTARTNLGLGSLATLSTIGTAQITDSAVTDAKISAVAATKITGTIATAQIADSAVTDAKISAVAATKITGTIATAQIANSAVTDAKISAVAATKITGTIATAQIADSAVTDAKISAVAASKLTGGIAPARVGVTVDKTLPYNNAGTLTGSNIFLDGIGGRSLWIAQDDFSSFFRLGSNLNTYVHLCNDSNNIIRTLGGGNALFINDNSDAITNIATGTGNTTLGNTTGTTTIYGSTLTIQGTTLKINVGSDAAGDIYYRDASGNFVRLPKGTDGQVLTLASGLPSWAATSGGVTGFTGSQNTSSPNNTVNASRLLVSASSTNADFVVQPKGTGAILAQLPDSTATGGNKRGDYAVDLQMIRNSASQVASGLRSFVGGGQSNTASGQWSAAFGAINTASGSSSFAAGWGNESVAYGTTSFGNYGKAYIDGQLSLGVIAQNSPTAGTCQTSIVTLCANTTHTTPTTMKAADTFSVIQINPIINNNCAIHFVAKIIGKSSTGDVATFMRDGVIKNISGATSLVGSIGTIGTDRADAGMSSCTVAITANDTNDRIDIEVTGVSFTIIRWTCTLIYTEVTL